MAQEYTCDRCKRSVEVVSEAGLCFVCETFQTFTAIIKEETELNDEESLDLAGALADHILLCNRRALTGIESIPPQRPTSNDGVAGAVTLEQQSATEVRHDRGYQESLNRG
jgi:hypothetical protein